MRTLIVWVMIIGGFALQGLSYLAWAAPLGLPTSEAFSNPRLPFAPLFFVIGVMVVFLSAVVYELLPDKKS